MPGPGRKFEKGKSGNPAGRPRLLLGLRERALKAVEEHVMAAWIDEVTLKERPIFTLSGPKLDEAGEVVTELRRGADWLACGRHLAEYGMGKPVQPVEHGGVDGEPLSITVRYSDETK